MSDIEVGEYVRTKDGFVGEIIDIVAGVNDKTIGFICGKNRLHSLIRLDNIKSHSKNIIDLIEVGDYVNGKFVEKIEQYEDGKSIIALIGIIDEKDIKSILTKEQYQANCYVVESEE